MKPSRTPNESNTPEDFSSGLIPSKRSRCARQCRCCCQLLGFTDRPEPEIVSRVVIVLITFAALVLYPMYMLLPIVTVAGGGNFGPNDLGVVITQIVCWSATLIALIIYLITKNVQILFAIVAFFVIVCEISIYINSSFLYMPIYVTYPLCTVVFALAAFGRCQCLIWIVLAVLSSLFVYVSQIVMFAWKGNCSIVPAGAVLPVGFGNVTRGNATGIVGPADDSAGYCFDSCVAGVPFVWDYVPFFFIELTGTLTPFVLATLVVWYFRRSNTVHLSKLMTVARSMSLLDLDTIEVSQIAEKDPNVCTGLEKTFQVIIANMRLYKSFIPPSLYGPTSDEVVQDDISPSVRGSSGSSAKSDEDVPSASGGSSNASESFSGVSVGSESGMGQRKKRTKRKSKKKKTDADSLFLRSDDVRLQFGRFVEREVTFMTVSVSNAHELFDVRYRVAYANMHTRLLEFVTKRSKNHGGIVYDITWDAVHLSFNSIKRKVAHSYSACECALRVADELGKCFCEESWVTDDDSAFVDGEVTHVRPLFRIYIAREECNAGYFGSTTIRRFVHVRAAAGEVGLTGSNFDPAFDLSHSLRSSKDDVVILVDSAVQELSHYSFVFCPNDVVLKNLAPVYRLVKKRVVNEDSAEWLYQLPIGSMSSEAEREDETNEMTRLLRLVRENEWRAVLEDVKRHREGVVDQDTNRFLGSLMETVKSLLLKKLSRSLSVDRILALTEEMNEC